jgi:hypothetical protein
MMHKNRVEAAALLSRVLLLTLGSVGAIILLAHANDTVEQQVIDNLASATPGDRIVCTSVNADLAQGRFTFTDVTYGEPELEPEQGPQSPQKRNAPAESEPETMHRSGPEEISEPEPEVSEEPLESEPAEVDEEKSLIEEMPPGVVLQSDEIVVDYRAAELAPMLLDLGKSSLSEVAIAARRIALRSPDAMQVSFGQMDMTLTGEFSTPVITLQEGTIERCEVTIEDLTIQNAITHTDTRADAVQVVLEGDICTTQLGLCSSILDAVSISCSNITSASAVKSIDYTIRELQVELSGEIPQAVVLGDFNPLFHTKGMLGLMIRDATFILKEQTVDTLSSSQLVMDLSQTAIELPIRSMEVYLSLDHGTIQVESLEFSVNTASFTGPATIAQVGVQLVADESITEFYQDIYALLEPVITTVTGSIGRNDLDLAIEEYGNFNVEVR